MAALACPACSLENPEGATECARCHLSVSLFAAVREAAGDDPHADPTYTETIGELLGSLGDPPTDDTATSSNQGELLYAHRFPSPGPGTEPAAPVARPTRALPALPPAGDVPLLLRQVNDYLQIARRQGLDLKPFTERANAAALTQDRATLESLSRDLFVHLAAALTAEYDGALGRRTELAGLLPTTSVDVELEGCRASLALGDVAGAHRRLRHIGEMLSDLEEQWATVQILVAESELLTETIRQLGGDPEPALGPLAEGRRRAREGDRTGAEPVLARAALALWTILNPLFQRELARIKERLVERRARGEDLAPAVQSLRQLATDLRHRNFASAVMTYRHLRSLVGDAPEPTPAAGRPTPATGADA